MATRYLIVDDLDGSTAGVEPSRFALEGVDYLIDLSESNRERLHAALAPFIAAARRETRNSRTRPQRAAQKANPVSNATIRTWWAEHWQSADLPEPRTHGMIPTRVRQAYQAAHATPTA
ncbi:Lsr2 family protein [Rugosimonospora acidiphila]|uniref:Lsr2 family protein n=1 Tax=Rugosimonospora acidiphila TaxID=556531 RepID=A0ABP9SSM5_9ACTN